jgi:hypothetical protein
MADSIKGWMGQGLRFLRTFLKLIPKKRFVLAEFIVTITLLLYVLVYDLEELLFCVPPT